MRLTTPSAALRAGLLVAAAHLVMAATPAGAQGPSPATVTGVVRDEGQKPIDEVEVRIVGGDRAARSSPNGVYQLDSVRAGQHMVQVRRMGYRPLYFTMTLKSGERREIDVELSPLPTRLSAVQVKERSGYGVRDAVKLRDFEQRRRGIATQARFLTRDDIAARHRGAGTLFNALRTEWPLTGCPLLAEPLGSRRAPSSLGRGRMGCRLAVSLDGGMAMDAATVVDYPLDLVEAVEIYRAGIGMPIEFQTGLARGADVVVVVWTGVDTDR